MNSIIERCIENSYDRKNFVDLVKNIIYFEDTSLRILPLNNSKNVDAFYELGKWRLKDDKSFSVLEVHLKDVELDKSPVYQAKFVADFLKKELVDFAIVSYYKDEESFWKFALVYIDIKKENEKLVVQKSDPRRYYFVVGSGVPIHTAEAQISLLYGKDNTFADILDAFSLEKVTKSFYQEVARKFYELVGGKTSTNSSEVSYGEGILHIPNNDYEDKKNFAIRLLDRLIFCWFLKKKKSTNGLPLIDDTILSSSAVSNYKSDISGVQFYGSYYHDILERLFFEVMNKRKRDKAIRNMKEFNSIPFLNGGLFEPKYKDFYEIKNNNSSNAYLGTLKIPDEWFKELFSVFERYNFTVDENTPVDVELSVEPEMLGRIFENLLAELIEETGEIARKSSGSYYTPREIVEYMVNESLKHYLLENTNVSQDKIDSLLSYYQEVDLNKEEQLEIVQALNKLKVIDPACGSGAFPIGVLQKELLILQKVDPDNQKWLTENLKSVEDVALKEELRNKFQTEELNYMRKLSLIKNSIYGVDIQPMATEISKLRAFLTLIVDAKVDDAKPNRGIEPLPNLEFKFVAANSLIDVEFFEKELKQQSSGSLIKDDFFEKFGELASQYFIESDSDKKRELQHKIETLIDKKVDEKLDEIANLTSSLDPTKSYIRKSQNERVIYNLNFQSDLWSSYKNIFKGDKPVRFFNPKYFFPEASDGFDIVFANPPYIQLQKNHGKFAELYKDGGYETFDRMGDIYCLFYERGMQLLKSNGHLCYISSNKWMRAGYGKKLRKFFIEYNPKVLVDLGPNVFENSTVDTNILLVQKSENKKMLKAVTISEPKKTNVDIARVLSDSGVILTHLSESPWFIGSEAEQKLKEKIEHIGKPLKDWDVKIYRGILTGLNEAFIIDTAKREEILRNCKDADERKRTEAIIKPILRGRDIKRYYYEWAGLWVIFIPWHFPLHEDMSIQGASEKAEKEFINQYPSVYNHLLQYKETLSKRNKEETGIRYEWYALQRCAATYYSEFEKEKIMWQELAQGAQFAFDDEGGFFVSNTAYILTGKRLKYIIGYLNSRLNEITFEKWYCTKLGQKGTRWLNQHVVEIPVPPITSDNKSLVTTIELLVDKIIAAKKQNHQADTSELEDEIDKLVYELYDLTPDEIKIIEGNIKKEG